MGVCVWGGGGGGGGVSVCAARAPLKCRVYNKLINNDFFFHWGPEK